MKKRKVALLLAAALVLGSLSGCGNSQSQTTQENADNGQEDASSDAQEANANSGEEVEEAKQENSGEKVTIKLFTGKIETIDVMNEIIEDFNKSQDRITVEQEYQKDASNIIKIKFASDEVPDIMTTYEQGFVDEGKYMDITEQNEWWDRMSPDMKAACTDVKQGKTFRVCTNMTMAGFSTIKKSLKSWGLKNFHGSGMSLWQC